MIDRFGDEPSPVKQYIMIAFLDLLGSQQLKQITVKDIIAKAGVSRSTFYLHFYDKFDLLQVMNEKLTAMFLAYYDVTPPETVKLEQTGRKRDLSEGIKQEMRQDNRQMSIQQRSQHTVEHLCQHIYRYLNFYKYAFQDPGMIQQLSHQLALKLANIYPDRAYAVFASYGTVGYLSFWINQDLHMQPHEVAQKLLAIGLTDWTQYTSAYTRTQN